MSLIKSYLSVLNEDTKKPSNVVADITGELEGSEKAKNFVKDSGPEANTAVVKPVEGPSQEDVKAEDSAPKAVKSESTNPFDVLYSKVLAQENWELEEEEEELVEAETENGGELGFPGLAAPEGTEEHEEAEEEGLEAVLAHLKGAVEALEKLVSGAEEEEEETEESSYPMNEEGVEIEELKGTEDLADKSKKEVKGAVPVSKGSATVVKGHEVDGKPSEFKGAEDLTDKKKQNVGGVKTGKSLFDQ
jgi:hypothetical protein